MLEEVEAWACCLIRSHLACTMVLHEGEVHLAIRAESPCCRIAVLGDLFLMREQHEHQQSLDRQGEKRWPTTWQIVE